MGNQVGFTESDLRAVLSCLLDLQSAGMLSLTAWEINLCKMKVTQAHYSGLESRAIGRLLCRFHNSGELGRALDARRDANSPENQARTIKNARSVADGKKNHTGRFWCVICNSGAYINYHTSNTGKLSILCDNKRCVRILEGQDIKRKPRFGNIIPHDRGTFLVESETTASVFYIVDVIEQTCSCDDYKFRRAELNFEHKCKHLLETNHAVYDMKAF